MREVVSTIRDDQGRKRCTKCGEWKPEHLFSYHRNPVDKLQSACRVCNQTVIRHAGQRHHLTETEYTELVAKNNGKCWICNRPSKPLVIDHDHRCCPGLHSCGKCVRGMLCSKCNKGIGLLDDSIDNLTSAIAYLKGELP